jgi:hypothetical protein
MALRLSDRIIRGEIINTKHYSTHGWLELCDVDHPIMLQLTGNCSPDLAGWHIRFVAKQHAQEYDPANESTWLDSDEPEQELPPEAPSNIVGNEADSSEDESFDDLYDLHGCEDPDPSGLAWQQVGPTGTMTADRQVRVFDCPVEEFLRRSELGEPPPTEWKRCLYLEWYSQNGRVVLELPDPVLEFVEHVQWPRPQNQIKTNAPTAEDPTDPSAEESPPEATGLGVTEIRLNDDGQTEITQQFFPTSSDDDGPDVVHFGEDAAEDDEPENPYQLFPPDLQKQLDVQAYHTDWTIQGETDDPEKPESIREMELMDYLIENSDGEQLDSACHVPVPLDKIDFLSDKQAEQALKDILGQLAMSGVALDVCKHFTPRMAYRLLLEEIFPEDRFFPELRGTRWVQHYSTWEYCPQCDAEIQKDVEESERRRREHPEEFENSSPEDMLDEFEDEDI